MQTSVLLDKGEKRILKFSHELETSATDDQQTYLMDYVTNYLLKHYKGRPYNLYIPNESKNLEAIVIYGINDFMFVDHVKQGHDIPKTMKVQFQGELKVCPVTEIILKNTDDRILLFYCTLPEAASDSQKKDFLGLIQDYVDKNYGKDEETSFYEESHSDTLSIVVLLNH